MDGSSGCVDEPRFPLELAEEVFSCQVAGGKTAFFCQRRVEGDDVGLLCDRLQ